MSIDEMYCPTLRDPFKAECSGSPREVFTGDVIDEHGLVVVARETFLSSLAGENLDWYSEWEDSVFDKRAETAPSMEFDCKESIGGVVKNINLEVTVSAIRRIEVFIGPLYCDPEAQSCSKDFDSASPYVETFMGDHNADTYLDRVVKNAAAYGAKDRLRLVTATYVGNLQLKLESEDELRASVDIPVNENLQLGLRVTSQTGRTLRMSTGSPDGPLGYTLSYVTKTLAQVEAELRSRREQQLP